ncbi:MAG: hypothetical protein HYY95_07145 [Candidatus Rokubacteria bacterium]|nr:hypothetical protein [Candidatus Rokubacteria bacterium]
MLERSGVHWPDAGLNAMYSALRSPAAAWHGRCSVRMQQGIVQEEATMRPIMQFLFARLPGPGLGMWAQQSLGPTPLAAMTPGSAPDFGAVDAGLVPIAAVVLLVLIVWSAVKLYDRSRKPDEEAVALQAKISDALMVQPSLSGLPLTPTVRMSLWRHDPVMIELSGSVPRPTLRQAAIGVALREVDSRGKGCSFLDRIAVTSARLGRAA